MIVRIAVTGGRAYTNKEVVYDALNSSLERARSLGLQMYLVVGDADGADALARQWAIDNGIDHKLDGYKADWRKYGPAAGPIRNKRMLDDGIDLLHSFPGGRGTAHMTEICRKVNVLVRVHP